MNTTKKTADTISLEQLNGHKRAIRWTPVIFKRDKAGRTIALEHERVLVWAPSGQVHRIDIHTTKGSKTADVFLDGWQVFQRIRKGKDWRRQTRELAIAKAREWFKDSAPVTVPAIHHVIKDEARLAGDGKPVTEFITLAGSGSVLVNLGEFWTLCSSLMTAKALFNIPNLAYGLKSTQLSENQVRSLAWKSERFRNSACAYLFHNNAKAA